MPITNRIRKLLVALALTYLAGIIGYEVIEGWSFLDAAYMTVITLATIGYGETHPLSSAGRVFTIFLILGGMTTVSYGALTLTALVADGELAQLLKRRRMDKAITQLTNHYIICGLGKTGEHVVAELLQTGKQVVVVDKNPDNLACFHSRDAISERFGAGLAASKINYVSGDAASDHVLIEAGIQRAVGIFCALASDKDNLFVVLTARGLNARIRIISKCEDDETEQKLLRAGADSIVSPKRIGGLRMASEMIRPAVVSFLDIMVRDPQGYRFEEVEVKAGSKFLGKPIRHSPAGEASTLRLVAIANPAADCHYNPSEETLLAAGQRLVFLGRSEQVERLRADLNSTG
ncbi:MAG: potassium channel protein [Verrucomicrobia bacterium]|nr:potassium channel protein [Verrucomicrobiota bacterium]